MKRNKMSQGQASAALLDMIEKKRDAEALELRSNALLKVDKALGSVWSPGDKRAMAFEAAKEAIRAADKWGMDSFFKPSLEFFSTGSFPGISTGKLCHLWLCVPALLHQCSNLHCHQHHACLT
jgi:hypothetical protein